MMMPWLGIMLHGSATMSTRVMAREEPGAYTEASLGRLGDRISMQGFGQGAHLENRSMQGAADGAQRARAA